MERWEFILPAAYASILAGYPLLEVTTTVTPNGSFSLILDVELGWCFVHQDGNEKGIVTTISRDTALSLLEAFIRKQPGFQLPVEEKTNFDEESRWLVSEIERMLDERTAPKE